MSFAPLGRLLLDVAAPDRPIASTGGDTISFRQFRADVCAATARLAAIDCRRGLLICEDGYWAAVGLFALAHSGAEVVLPPNSLPATLAALNGAYDHVITDGALAHDERVLRLATGGNDPTDIVSLESHLAAVTLFTSGSTGAPKRVAKSLRQFETEAHTVESLLGKFIPREAWVHGTVTHQHLYGLTFRVCWPLSTGRPFYGALHEFWEPMMSMVDKDAVIVTSPSHLSRLGGLPPLPLERRPSAILSGGAPLPDIAAEAAIEILGRPVLELFGSTEAGVVGSRLREGTALSWRPLPGVSVTRTEDGRMHIRSPYLDDAEGVASEDIIEVDSDGGFHLIGRSDRIVKVEGVRISLNEFEQRLNELNGVAQAAVAVLNGDAPYLGAVVVLDAAGAIELEQQGKFRLSRRLRIDLARSLPAASLPRQWRFVAEMPSGPLGKIRSSDLAALFEV